MNAIPCSHTPIWGTHCLALVLIALLLHASPPAMFAAPAALSKMKLRGYLTARLDDSTVAILDDHIQLAKGGRVELRDPSAGPAPTFAGLAAGQLIEAEGIWEGKHRFSADQIILEPGLLDKSVHETAYLQGEPADGPKIAAGESAELKADGEWLMIGTKTHREWLPGQSRRPVRQIGACSHR